MENAKTIDTHIATTTRLDMDETGSHVNETMYRGIIGSLLYLTVSKPDIIFSVLGDNFDLVGYADVDHVGYLGTKKQNHVALSTIEAEYVDVASCCAQLLLNK
nr:uncharacterized protein LOC117274548 [Nicotiana tomentosiformis]